MKCACVFAYGMDVVVYVSFDSQPQVSILIIDPVADP